VAVRVALVRAVGALAVAALLAGCGFARTVGDAAPSSGPDDVPASQLRITGATGGAVDQLARNALADLQAYWSATFPRVYGKDFPPLTGGYFSVDSRDVDRSAYPPTGIGCAEQPIPPSQVAGNAFYNPTCDAIAYDRTLLSSLAGRFGRTLPAVVMAHEFGHAVQGRVGFAAQGRSIQDETQADCFAGAFVGWEVQGSGHHLTIRTPEIDNVLRGYVTLRDPIGSDPDGQQAHGSYFDRVAAFSDGFDKGAGYCRTGFGEDRVFTQAPFTTPADYVDRGNSSYSETLDILGRTLPAFWRETFPQLSGQPFRAPAVRGFSGTGPACLRDQGGQRELGYCRSGATVWFDQRDLTRPAHDRIGDWAVGTAIALPYGEAVRAELGRSTDDDAATRSEVCLAGWYTRAVFDDRYAPVDLSPGDVDESVVFLLSYGVSDRVFPGSDATGFELLRAFRDGFVQGGGPCGVGA
jgi:predicted metalloprotease